MRECPSAWVNYKLPVVREKLARNGEKRLCAFGGKDGTRNGAGHTRFDRQNWGRERRKYSLEKMKGSKLEEITQMELQGLEEEYDGFFGEELYISMADRDGVRGMGIEGRLSTKEGGKVEATVVVDTGASCSFLSKEVRRKQGVEGSHRVCRTLRIKSSKGRGRKR